MDIFSWSKDKATAIFLCFLLSLTSLTESFNALTDTFISTGFIWETVILYGLLMATLVIMIIKAKFEISNGVLFLLIFFTVIASVSMMSNSVVTYYIFGRDIPIYEKPIFNFFLFSFAGLLAASYLGDKEEFIKYFTVFSYVVILLAVVRFFFLPNTKNRIASTYMTFSYGILLQTVFLTISCFRKFNIWKAIVAMMGFILIFVAGCRGALVSYMGTIILYLAFYSFDNPLKKMLFLIFLGVLTFVVYKYFSEIIDWIANILLKLRIDSRTISKLKDADFVNDSGRSSIQKLLFQDMNLFGHGFFGDRIYAYSYAHNLLIELLYDFGKIGGSLLFGIYIIILLAGLVRANKNERALIIVLISTGLIKLMFSGSYLEIEPGLYVLIGLCANISKTKVEEKEVVSAKEALERQNKKNRRNKK